ncbi:hypothetical protein [Achromobacter sp. LC458]|uniref:hypothetical protein n=1 Tax=Achromobacter sp. LC458 TaxID=1120623 RepID=UPI001C8F40E1|nr:hypothetical protein [Achromobacter sp. LC458]
MAVYVFGYAIAPPFTSACTPHSAQAPVPRHRCRRTAYDDVRGAQPAPTRARKGLRVGADQYQPSQAERQAMAGAGAVKQ